MHYYGKNNICGLQIIVLLNRIRFPIYFLKFLVFKRKNLFIVNCQKGAALGVSTKYALTIGSRNCKSSSTD